MKHCENEYSWKIALEEVEKIRNNEQQYSELTDEDIDKRCCELAIYNCND